ncbi:hypothetical protein A2334_00540 [Candidatus Roizmanbacteria bacterium RIFOXYB2_FULL_38_10]|uniref:CHASE domain-containing protein n=1 Tax=Candidatus Roizmanbacteria bacterium RIFOXYD1_FULL_38_12 TaxID=1802093 RepID=A0A1F7L1D0_9BACT|nr:MAG: hypothetical protein A3K47_03810 [Candidatus Roizmanbacteria bacterium RIFOXYA2_FULL_38_14]OGK63883.1 MAG: hypothetical protein A3K27_03810 [Candidatus Roizmanbacteria bacterium RIFOXYA1_FULL_37_12]OGK65729.1 MAG: hypothetical protein A3K38_03810 [Candidatus Roizmanbacteria bacterium RIFOXYB1_FULL_40_23]OGK68174.1 MAG: hypothetical protein A2334_00540 [Candidatus Roizmanbacteria bacterium RIFOXYB2_FULL_38_10]OGK70134.1 MAG: hypothetical protein A3K21_03815 [Candidatus Roizmanbacteria ba
MSEHIYSTIRKDFLKSLIALLILLMMNFFSWQVMRTAVMNNVRERFMSESQFLKTLMQDRIKGYVQNVKEGKRWFRIDDTMTRKEFDDYFQAIKEEDVGEGMEGILYVAKVTALDKDSFVDKVRQDKATTPYGYPFFNIHVSEEKKEYYVVNYMVPHETFKNFFGNDIGLDPTLNTYFDQARDSGDIIVTPELQLFNLKRMLIVQPIYSGSITAADTKEKKQQQLKGFVVSVLKADSLFDGLLKDSTNPMSYAVYDGKLSEDMLPKNIAFYEDSNETVGMTKKEDLFISISSFTFADRIFTVFFSSKPTLGNGIIERNIPDIFLIVTSVLSCVMFLLMNSFIRIYEDEKSPSL